MMINRILASTKRFLPVLVLPVLALLAPHAKADNIAQDKDPCGVLTTMGQHTSIYNNSQYDWNVVFITSVIGDDLGKTYNAGAVKYLSGDGWWVDTGIGDYRRAKTYTVPVGAGKTVAIAYCADRSGSSYRIDGKVFFSAANAALTHGTPVGNVSFNAHNSTPYFSNNGTTPFVNYNRNLDTVFENGSLTICPNDPACKLP